MYIFLVGINELRVLFSLAYGQIAHCVCSKISHCAWLVMVTHDLFLFSWVDLF